ncbi:nuclear transport factor 2 family protein [Microbulbifer sp.]|uniref:nuclear transport factor 2 family protein n=1 Tax=Microbulbifer sp. TaxID=1908541 RepID=UPI003F3BA714
MDGQEKLLIEWECQQLLNRVTNLIDDARWQELAGCYTEDAVLFRPSDPDVGIEGRDAIIDSFQQRAPRLTRHFFTNSVFEVLSPVSVRATSRVLLLSGPAGETLPAPAAPTLLAGSFVDTLSRIEGRWLIARRKGSVELKYSYDA